MSEESGVNFEEVAAIDRLLGLAMILRAVVVGGPDLLVGLELSPPHLDRLIGDSARALARVRGSARP